MARCPIKSCRWTGKKDGVPIHLARMHGVHREDAPHQIEAIGESWAVEATVDLDSGKVSIKEVPVKPERLMEPIIERW